MKKLKSHAKDYQDYFLLRDAADAYEYGSIKSDRRIQVKLPSFIVDEIDKEFPGRDRSNVIARATLEVLLRKKRLDDSGLDNWQAEEQYDLDRMWDFLSEIEKESDDE